MSLRAHFTPDILGVPDRDDAPQWSPTEPGPDPVWPLHSPLRSRTDLYRKMAEQVYPVKLRTGADAAFVNPGAAPQPTIHEKPQPVYAAPYHTRDAYDMATMPKIVDWATRLARTLNADAVAAVGHSGLTVAGAVAYVNRIPVFAVRKPGEEKLAVGGGNMVTAVAPNGPAQRWLWLDDFVGSGGTFRNAVEQLWKRRLIASPVPVGILQYNRSERESMAWAPDHQRLGLTAGAYPGVVFPTTIPVFGFRKDD